MARTINDIQQSIITDLQTYFPKLSTSKVAEWRLWTYVVAAAIHAFEIILDLFRQEVDELTAKITPGTKLWYAEMCYRFQNGHTLVFDKNTAQFYYEQDDPDSRIVKVVAVNEVYKMISIRVAKTDGEGRIVPLDDNETPQPGRLHRHDPHDGYSYDDRKHDCRYDTLQPGGVL